MSMLEHTLILTLSHQYGVPLRGRNSFAIPLKTADVVHTYQRESPFGIYPKKLPQPPHFFEGAPSPVGVK
ncbi:hypothetical protein, partial [Priestia megaterium]|uniref:hypothetical protein n=1 Tax=Priestia megaterium TaxID=1404 RepID=UPI001C9A1D69